MKNDFRARGHPAWWAFCAHRASGLLLALFLPAHFLMLGTALEGEARFDNALKWTEQPMIKFGEIVLVVLLAAHMSGGVRLLVLEFLPWRDWQKTLIALATGVTACFGLAFLLNLV